MNVLLLLPILTSHVLAAVPFFRALRNGRVANVVDFAALGMIVYFDFGLLVEASGLPYTSTYFTAFFAASERAQLVCLGILMVAPWLLRLGARFARPSAPRSLPLAWTESLPVLHQRRKPLFYVVALGLSGLLGIAGWTILGQASSIWQARVVVGALLGPAVVILYVPLHFLAFYVRVGNSRSTWGRCFTLVLAALAVAATLPIGQRTNVLLPLVIILVFATRVSPAKLAAVGAVGLVLASLMLSLFKYQGESLSDSVPSAIGHTIISDFHRANVMAEVVDDAPLLGTRTMPYPGAGYVYAALFFVPRSLAPIKGASSASYLTGDMVGEDAMNLDWGFAFGMIEEIILNFGLAWVLPGLFLYGVALGLLDRLTARYQSSMVAARLAAVWMCGYHLPAVLLTFGTMLAVSWCLGKVFSVKTREPSSASPQWGTGGGVQWARGEA